MEIECKRKKTLTKGSFYFVSSSSEIELTISRVFCETEGMYISRKTKTTLSITKGYFVAAVLDHRVKQNLHFQKAMLYTIRTFCRQSIYEFIFMNFQENKLLFFSS